MSRPLAFLRRMHTPGRQIPHTATPSTSPSPHGHVPLSASASPSPVPAPGAAGSLPLPLHLGGEGGSGSGSSPALSTSPRTYRKLAPAPPRPPRTARVTLPSGLPEPPTFPPPQTYLDDMAALDMDPDAKRTPHPLWAFFHVPAGADKSLTAASGAPPDGGSVEVVSQEQFDSGRAWTAPELRLKSFADLHTLWYVLLRERNVLATQREERRRLQISPNQGGDEIARRAFRIRKSMSRIKYVLNERRLALLALPVGSGPHSAPAPIPFAASVPGVGGAHVLPDPASGAVAHAMGPDAIDALAARVHGLAEAVAEDASAAEVEGRDEGHGGGAEAREFVEGTQVVDGHVRQA
ncbi:54S ribosomal protein L4 mitochondrial [Cryptotrichosporon argae]